MRGLFHGGLVVHHVDESGQAQCVGEQDEFLPRRRAHLAHAREEIDGGKPFARRQLHLAREGVQMPDGRLHHHLEAGIIRCGHRAMTASVMVSAVYSILPVAPDAAVAGPAESVLPPPKILRREKPCRCSCLWSWMGSACGFFRTLAHVSSGAQVSNPCVSGYGFVGPLLLGDILEYRGPHVDLCIDQVRSALAHGRLSPERERPTR